VKAVATFVAELEDALAPKEEAFRVFVEEVLIENPSAQFGPVLDQWRRRQGVNVRLSHALRVAFDQQRNVALEARAEPAPEGREPIEVGTERLEHWGAGTIQPGEQVELTPSDVFFLRSSAWAAEIPSVQFSEPPVRRVIEWMVALALLADEATGALRFETVRVQRLFGLSQATCLFLHCGDGSIAWPVGSLEQAMLPRQVSTGDSWARPYRVSDLIRGWLRHSQDHSWIDALSIAKEQATEREMLEVRVIQRKRLHFFDCTSSVYSLPEATSLLLKRQPYGSERQLLEACTASRPDLFGLLMEDIEQTLALPGG
jgi:hypothetical protein